MSPRYYDPYTVLSTLDGRRRFNGLGVAFGQAGRISLPTQTQLDSVKPQSHRAAAAELGIKLPAVPANLKGDSLIAWKVMESMTIINARLTRVFEAMTLLLARGGLLCEDMNIYNRAAIRQFRLQQKQLRTMRDLGMDGIPDKAPFPDLFVGRGALQSTQVGVLDCEAGAVVSNRDVIPSISCPDIVGEGGAFDGLGLGPLAYFGIVAVVTIGGVVLGSQISDDWKDVRLDEQRARRAEIEAEWLDRRMALLMDFIERCEQRGQSFDDCLRNGLKALPQDLKGLRKDTDDDRSILWWIGLGTVLVAAGVGVGIYITRRKG